MKYGHVLSYVAATPWAILPAKLHEILSVLAFRAAGHEYTRDEIQARIGEPEPVTSSQQGAVGVLPIRGTIAHRMGSMDESSGGVSTERLGAMFSRMVADPSIGTIVLDVDSPGGTIPGVSELAGQIYAARGQKKIVAVANSLMASAAYWIASQADEIISIPSGTVGSIGVFTAHEDLSKALELEGIDITLISAGRYKVEGNPFEPLSDDAREVLQARVDAAYGQFVKDVARGRGVSVADVKGGYGEGRALSAKDAKVAGLIDRIGTMDDTIGRLVGRKSPASLRAESDFMVDVEGADVLRPADVAALLAAEAEDADRLRRLRLL